MQTQNRQPRRALRQTGGVRQTGAIRQPGAARKAVVTRKAGVAKPKAEQSGSYTIGKYTFPTVQAMQAGKRDLMKIKALQTPTGSPREQALSYLRQIKQHKFRFETDLGKDFVKAQADVLNETMPPTPVTGDKERFFEDEKKAQKEEIKRIRRENGFAARPQWQKVSLVMLGAILITLLTILGHELYGDFLSRKGVKELKVATEMAIDDTEIVWDEASAQALESSGVQVLSWDGKEILPQFKPLVLENPDFAGWLTIAGTPVDYPVMHRDDNEYYLDHNFDGEHDVNGLLVLDKDCSVDGTDDNVLIHGHNMKSGFMFGALKNYKNRSYYEEHPTIKFCSLYQENVYDIIAVFLSSVDDNSTEDFHYYNYVGMSNAVEFESYINGIKEASLYDIPYSAQYGDHLITLSTCDYSKRDGRLVVVGRKRFL